MLYIFFLSKDDNIKNLDNSSQNIRGLTDWPKI